ncbi:MAG: PQQ-binding-like beta-propeller repeat protein [Phycisphaerales bacterium]|nr:PQQ-binding-like beta-propeller repeat protein [Phycisphaerales bacterium]
MAQRARTRLIRAVLASALPLFSSAAHEAAAQDAPPPPPSTHALHDVYVDDSFESRDALSRARVLADAGRWEEAAATLQQTVERYGAMLTPADSGVYINVRTHVARLISTWPNQGVAAWRRLYESAAEKAFAQAQTGAALADRVAPWELYFPSGSAGRWTDSLAEYAIESGRLATARRLYETALQFHPDRRQHEPRWRARLALIHAMSGDFATARHLLDLSGKPDPVRWMGEDREIPDILREIEQSFASLHAPAPCDGWPTLSLDPARSANASCEVDNPGLLWRLAEGPSPRAEGLAEPGDEAATMHMTTLEAGRLLSGQPVVVGSLVITQRGADIVACQLASGTRVWRAVISETPSPEELDGSPILEAPCVADGRVYAVAPEHQAPGYGADSVEATTALICLDADDGTEWWRRRPAEFGPEHGDVAFDAAPLARGEQVFVVGRKRRAFGFEDCYLYRLSRADGSLLSRAHLGSASTGSFGYRRTTFSVPAADADLVFVCTNLGTVAAIREDNGAVAWLRAYPQSPTRTRAGRSTAGETAPWQFGPPLVWEDHVAVLPSDSDELLVLGAGDGRILARAPRDQLGGAESLLGMAEKHIFTVGASVVASDLGALTPVWSTPLPDGAELFGRGVVLRDRVLVPTPRWLCSFRVSDGARTQRPWDAEGEGGNLVALPDMLLVAGDGKLSAYLRREDIWNSMRSRMAASPEDPGPALDFAEAALRDGEWVEAEGALEETNRRAERSAERLEPGFRKRFQETLLNFAERSRLAGRLTGAQIDRLFEWAAPCAVDREMHVEQRLRFSEWYEALGNVERAVRLQQQILMDRSLRGVEVQGRGTWKQPAASLAERNIARLLTAHGAAPYAAFEEQAARSLETAKTSKDAAQIGRVVESFPNSETAPRALLALGELLMTLNRPLDAAQRLTEAYYRYPKALNRPDLIRRIAEAQDRAGRRASAYGWLTKGAREFPTATVETAGGRTTFAELRRSFEDARAALEPRRPALRLPLRAGYTIEFDDEPTLLTPWFDQRAAHDASGFFVHVAGQVRRYDAASGAPTWPEGLAVSGNPRVLTCDARQVVIATPHEVVGVDARTGQRRWTIGRAPQDLKDPARDWEGVPVFTSFIVQQDRLLCVRDNGEAMCANIEEGRVLWEQALHPAPGRDLACGDDWITYTAVDGRRLGWFRMAWDAPADVRGTPVDELGPILRVLNTFDGQVLLISAEKVAAFDPASGECRWVAAPGGRIRESALLADFDGLYLTVDGRSMLKLSLSDGQELWRSLQVASRGDEGLSLILQDGNLIVSDARGVTALDGMSGQTLWKGTAPERCNLLFRAATQSYFAVIDARPASDDVPTRAFFYDHRNASGLLPREGGVLNLAPTGDITTAVVCDHALVVQMGKTLQGWVDTPARP